MTARVAAGLGLLALVLTGSIAYEIAGRDGEAAATVASRGAAAPAGLPQAAPAADHDGDLRAILARPVFNPDRRPIGTGERSVAGLSRLTGILVTPSRRIAIFASASGDASIVAEEGSHINAYEITAIGDSGVTVSGPGGTVIVRPVFDPSPPVASRPVITARPPLPVSRTSR